MAAEVTYPKSFKMVFNTYESDVYGPWAPYVCSILGLVSGMIIAAFTEYVTSHSYKPVRELADSCKAGPASNVTLGLALGYMSTVIPVIFIALTALIAN